MSDNREKLERGYQYAKALAMAKYVLEDVKESVAQKGSDTSVFPETPQFNATGVPSYTEAEQIKEVLEAMFQIAGQYAHEGRGPKGDEAANALGMVSVMQRMVPVMTVIGNAEELANYAELKDEKEFKGFLKDQFEPMVGNALDAMKLFKIETGQLKLSSKTLGFGGGRTEKIVVVDIPAPTNAESAEGKEWLKYQRMATVAGLLMEGLDEAAHVSCRWSGSKNDYELYVKGESLENVRDALGGITAELPAVDNRPRMDVLKFDGKDVRAQYIDQDMGERGHAQGTLVFVGEMDPAEQRKILLTLRALTHQENLKIRGDDKEKAIYVHALKPADIQNRLPGQGRSIAQG